MQSSGNEPEYEDREYKAQKRIKNYIKTDLFPKGTDYTVYDFRPLILMKHPEVIKLNKLFERKAYMENNKSAFGKGYEDSLATLEQIIQNQKDSIKTNHWSSQYKMEHLFSITDQKDKKTIYEMRFFLNFTLDSVTYIEPIMDAVEPKAMRGVFYHFYSEMGLSNNYDQDEEFYTFYKKHLAEIDNPIERGVFLEHCMEVTAIAASKNAVDVNLLSKGMIQSFIKKDTLFTTGTKIDQYGQLYETIDTVNGQAETLKYDRDALFLVQNDSTLQKDSLGLRFEFDKYLKINDIYTLQPPYSRYFENK